MRGLSVLAMTSALGAMTACGLLPTNQSEEIAVVADEVIEIDDSEMETRRSLPTRTSDSPFPNLRQVSRPISASWLLEPTDMAVANLDAREAIAVALGSRAVRFDLQLPSVPTISW